MNNPYLYLCGAAGALLYGIPILLAALALVPPPRFVWATLGFSVFLGAIIAPVAVPLLGHRFPFLLQPEPYPLAVGIGLVANPLVPIIIRKVVAFAEAFNLGSKKP